MSLVVVKDDFGHSMVERFTQFPNKVLSTYYATHFHSAQRHSVTTVSLQLRATRATSCDGAYPRPKMSLVFFQRISGTYFENVNMLSR